ncbi:Structural maintenance of chromosomes protein 6 [Trichoplax sp. H2]|nr:Structural maintenance of chromosomes protein 6 [Trichoplax sp. H2]|eukprot:RDD37414.1 Structural maintenance of chromosomes protein 6 [Trichoplax sp. H2]
MADRHKRWIDDEDDCIIVSSNTLPKKRRVEESQDSQQNADHKRWIDDEDDCIIVSSNTLPQKRRVEESQDSQQKADHDYHDEQALDDDQIESNNSQSDDQKTSGIILQIQLINFMCHSNLTVTLGENVNFVIGRNGSGKSAIMTGIIICLGGRSSVTNRASSLKEFIKKGSNYARIIITLANNGPDAYRAVDFGPNIFLERHIWNDGHSTYKLKSAEGEIIAKSNKELQNILEHYNIQIDNPASFLTQDASREFLGSQNEAKKYQFFFKATQLDQIYNNLICASDAQQYLIAAVNKKEKIIEEQKQVVEHHRSRLRFLDHLEKIENDLQQLKVSLAWAYVRIEEEASKLQQFKDAVTQIEKSIAKVKQRQSTINEDKEKLSESRKDVELEITKLTDKLHNLQVKKASLDTEKKSCQDEKLSCNRKCQEVKRSINHAENDRDMLQKKIDEIMERDEGTQARLTRESKITSLNEELDRLQSTLSKATDSKAQLEYSRKKEETDLQELRPKIFYNEKTKRNLEDEIKRLEASSQNRLEVYGHYMPELVRRVQEAHQRRRFHKFPLGPLGL